MTGRTPLSADDAIRRLREGNRRFVTGISGHDQDWEHARRLDPRRAQRPIAIVLGCSDSRVPLEVIFDQGFGELFVIRVAGNIAAPTQIGSIEYAVTRFSPPLVVVLGHSNCCAVAAAIDGLFDREISISPHVGEVVRRIQPVVETVRDAHRHLDRHELLAPCVRENARANAALLTRESSPLARRVADGRLRIVGAEYALESGRVSFL